MDRRVAAGTKTRVGIEHIGVTVPDIPAATRYFEHAFGAEVMFDLVAPDGEGDPRLREEALAACDAIDYESVLGAPSDARIGAVRMLGLGNGPLIELFEYTVAGQRDPVVPSDLGLQHICIYVDDIDAAAARVAEAGGRLLAGPHDMSGPEAGQGNRYMYTKTPWGMTIELISYPSVMRSEEGTDVLRPARRLP
jgi:catechol 2,3-dioxygenase-like lactoylglutathione lyase family enzyme